MIAGMILFGVCVYCLYGIYFLTKGEKDHDEG